MARMRSFQDIASRMVPDGSNPAPAARPRRTAPHLTRPLRRLMLAQLVHERASPGSPSEDADDFLRRERDVRFVERVYRLRMIGLGLGFLCVAAVFWMHREPLWEWLVLALYGFAWPHVAKQLALRSNRPVHVELWSLSLDSALGGAWLALMQFNLLPSVLLATMLCVDKIAIGGVPLAARTTALLLVTAAAVSAMLGFPVALGTPTAVMIACLPFLVAYPIALAVVMHRLSRKVAQQNRRLTALGRTDELTGLANRGQGFAAAGIALARYRRRAGPAVLLILDVDHFKGINDRFGHPAGDEVLRDIGHIIGACARATDTAARYAGDEFMLVLPDTDLAGAREIANRIRERVSRHEFEHARGAHCTVSLGAAQAHWGIGAVEEWVQHADAALYQAKSTGRDRVVGAVAFGEERPWRRVQATRAPEPPQVAA